MGDAGFTRVCIINLSWQPLGVANQDDVAVAYEFTDAEGNKSTINENQTLQDAWDTMTKFNFFKNRYTSVGPSTSGGSLASLVATLSLQGNMRERMDFGWSRAGRVLLWARRRRRDSSRAPKMLK